MSKKKIKSKPKEKDNILDCNIMNIFPYTYDGEEFEIEVSINGRMFKGVISLDEDDIDD